MGIQYLTPGGAARTLRNARRSTAMVSSSTNHRISHGQPGNVSLLFRHFRMIHVWLVAPIPRMDCQQRGTRTLSITSTCDSCKSHLRDAVPCIASCSVCRLLLSLRPPTSDPEHEICQVHFQSSKNRPWPLSGLALPSLISPSHGVSLR